MPGCLSLFHTSLPRCCLPRKSCETATPPHDGPTISLHNTHNSEVIPSTLDKSRGNHSAEVSTEDEGSLPPPYEASPMEGSSQKNIPSGTKQLYSPANSTDANASSADGELLDTSRQYGYQNHRYNLLGDSGVGEPSPRNPPSSRDLPPPESPRLSGPMNQLKGYASTGLAPEPSQIKIMVSNSASDVINLVGLADTDNGRIQALQTVQLKSGPFSASETISLVALFDTDNGRVQALRIVQLKSGPFSAGETISLVALFDTDSSRGSAQRIVSKVDHRVF